jgi:hypothetical protein
MADLGDITGLLKEAALNDLSWLDVDDKSYRELDTLPKQNLDSAPDLEALWAHEDQPATAYFDKERPHTMGDLSQSHGYLRAKPEDVLRVARVTVMQSQDPNWIKSALVARFDTESLRGARTALASVLAERGLLGRFYIEAADFPGCHNSPKPATDFVRKHAGDARFVKAKSDCHNCIHASHQTLGGTTCAVFHKELVVEVPYSDALAEQVERLQASKGKAVQASVAEPKERIRRALLAMDAGYGVGLDSKPIVDPTQFMKPTVAPEPVIARVDLSKLKEAAREAIGFALREARVTVSEAQSGYRLIAAAQSADDLRSITTVASTIDALERSTYVGAGQRAMAVAGPTASAEMVEERLVAASTLTRKRDEAAQRTILARKAEPVLTLLRREMLKGRSASELVHALKLAFQSTDLQETRTIWEPLFREAGLFGAVYSTQDAFDDCHEGADFLAKHSSGVRAVVAGTKCSGCIYNKMSRCMMYGRALVKDASEVVTWDVAEAVLQEYVTAGRIPPAQVRTASQMGTEPRLALKALHTAAAIKPGSTVSSAFRNDVFTAFNGTGPVQTTSGMTRRDIVKTASRYLNEGLYGEDLLQALKASYDVRDITAARDELRGIIAEQGLQGIYYVDASVYDDYGKGCNEPARLFRAKGVPYVKVGAKCTSCVHQTRVGFCSVINKPLVVEPPYHDKAAQQRAVLASGNSTEISYENLQNNGLTMMAEYQMQNGAMDFELAPEPTRVAAEVHFHGGRKIKL